MRFRADSGAPFPDQWRFPMPPRDGDALLLNRHAPEGEPPQYDLQEFSPSRGTGLFVGTYADLQTALFAAALWIAVQGDPVAFRREYDPRDMLARRLASRFGLPAETAEVVAGLAFGGRSDG